MSEQLPRGWEWATVADVADVQLGRQRSPQYHNGDQMRPYLRSANVTWDGISIEDVNEMNFDDADFAKYRLEPGDLLLNEASGSPNEVGKPAIWNGAIDNCCFQNTLLRLRPGELNRSYLYWYCYWSALMGRFGEAGRGVNIRHLGKRGLVQFPIPVAPLAEQHRIVTAIEEHLSRLDAADSALDGSEQRLDRLLSSVLASSCAGPWPKKPLSEVVHSLKNGVFVSRPSVDPPGEPIFRISAVRPLQLRVDDVRYAHPPPERAKKYAVDAGDLLFTRYSGNPDYVGAAAVVPREGAGVLHPDKLIRVVANREEALPEWIAAYVTAREGRREIEKRLKTTAGQVGIAGSQLKTVPIAVPPIDHQEKMIAKIAEIQTLQRRMERELSAARARGKTLRRSILAAAFSGQLVEQDSADEPASVLLERVVAERPARKTRMKTSA